MKAMYQKVFEEGYAVVKKIQETQEDAIKQCARLIADAYISNHTFFVSGSGHSHTVSEEFYGRAGGLAFTVPILTSELTMTEHPTKSSYIEKLSGYAEILCELYHIQEGAKVVAVTSVAHSSATTSRAKSKQKLMDIADVVIDNCGVLGDACLKMEGMDTLMMPTSSIANAFIVQAVSVLSAQYIMEAGKEAPVFVSLNGHADQSVNDELYRKYTRLY